MRCRLSRARSLARGKGGFSRGQFVNNQSPESSVKVHVQIALSGDVDGYSIPHNHAFRSWAGALADRAFEICVRVVDEDESMELNRRYRGRSYAANVLGFPFVSSLKFFPVYLGDIVICAPLLVKGAASAGVSLESNWARLFFHGLLHLCGYDHDSEIAAKKMAEKEAELLSSFGYDNPLLV